MTRRRIAKIASLGLAVAVLLLAGRTCASDLADITIRFERGDAPAIELIEARLINGDGEPVARFERHVAEGATGVLAEWTLQVDPGTYQLEIDLAGAGGETARDRRTIEASPRAHIAIDLGRSFRQDR